MTKAQLIAALSTFGITLPADATNTQLQAALDEAKARKAVEDAAAEDAKRLEEEAKARKTVEDAASGGTATPLEESPKSDAPAAGGAGDPPAAAASNAGASSEVIDYVVPPLPWEEIPAVEIIGKMQAGLTREQAIEVIQAQRRHDAGQD